MTSACQSVAIDTNFLIALSARRRAAPWTAGIDLLMARLEREHAMIVVPTPAIAEYLASADDGSPESIAELWEQAGAVVGSFDLRAALELSSIDRAVRKLGAKKGQVDAPWQKIKIDRQIVAIARSHGCSLIVTNDRGLAANAAVAGIGTCWFQSLAPVASSWPREPSVRESRPEWTGPLYPTPPSSDTSHSRNTAVSSRGAASRDTAR